MIEFVLGFIFNVFLAVVVPRNKVHEYYPIVKDEEE